MYGNSDEIRSLLLCVNDIDLIDEVRCCDGFTASKLSSIWGISIQNASTKLRKLVQKGYLKSKSRTAKSGGIEYVFTVEKGL